MVAVLVFVVAIPIAGSALDDAPCVRHHDRRVGRCAGAPVPVAARVRARRASTRRRSGSRSVPTSTSRRCCASTAVPRRRVGSCGASSWRPRSRCSWPPATAWRGPHAVGCSRWSGWAAVWVPARYFPDTSVLAPEAGLTLAALGLALCVGITVSVFVDGIRTFRFGWRQPAAIIGAFAIVLPVAGVHRRRVRRSVGRARLRAGPTTSRSPRPPRARANSACSGPATRRSCPSTRSSCATAPATCSPATVPATSPSSGARRSTTPTSWSTARSCSRPRAAPTVSVGCSRRWVCATSSIPSTQGTGRWRDAADAPVATRRAMAQQLDLARLRSSRGLVLYENLAYAPIRAAVPPPSLPVDSRRPNRAALVDRSHACGAAPDRARLAPAPRSGVRPTTRSGRRPAAATRSGTRSRSAGPTGSSSTGARTVSIAYEAQWVRWAMLGGALGHLAARDLAVAAHPGPARPVDPGGPRPRPPGARGDAPTRWPSSTTRRSGGSGCERRRADPRGPTPGSDRLQPRAAAVDGSGAARSCSSWWWRSSPRSWRSRTRRRDSDASTAAVVARAGVGVPAADVASSTWYCAAGTSTPDGDATETVVIASLARTDIEATITVMPGGDAASGHRPMRLAPGEEVSVPVADVLATPEPGVVVETVGGPAAVSHVLEHEGDVAVESCTRTAAPDWYFASGTTVEGSQHDLLLFNPFGDDAIVDISFVTDTGAQEPAELQALVVPRRSRGHHPGAGLRAAPGAWRDARPRADGPRRRRADADVRPTSSSTARPATASRSRPAPPRPRRCGGSPAARPVTGGACSSRWPTSPTTTRAST